MRINRVVPGMLMSIVAACSTGPNAGRWAVANRPEGAVVEITASSGRTSGELLEVANDGVYIARQDGKLVFAPYPVITLLRAPAQGRSYTMGGRMPPQTAIRAKLVVISHFPQGMTPEIRAKMLALAGQSEFIVLQ